MFKHISLFLQMHFNFAKNRSILIRNKIDRRWREIDLASLYALSSQVWAVRVCGVCEFEWLAPLELLIS